MKKTISRFFGWVNRKSVAAVCAALALVGSVFAEGSTPQAIDISTDAAESIKLGLVKYLTDISPMVLTILASGIGIGLLFWIVRLFLRGTKATSR